MCNSFLPERDRQRISANLSERYLVAEPDIGLREMVSELILGNIFTNISNEIDENSLEGV